MFAKLCMNVDEVFDEFCTMAEEVYKQEDITPEDRTLLLQKLMTDLMTKRGLPIDMKITDEPKIGKCACFNFVVTSPRINAGTKICLRGYPVQSHPSSTVTIVEAVLATCAVQPAFSPVSFGLGYRTKEYIGAGLGASNPVREVITEANLLFGGGSTVASLLSVGAGHPGVITLPSDGGEVDLLKAMRDMMGDCTEIAREIKQKIGRSGIYFRLSVQQGIQSDHPSQTLDLGWIVTQTESYLEEHVEQIAAFSKHSRNPTNTVTLTQLKSGNVRTVFPANMETIDLDHDTKGRHEALILEKLKPADLECGSPVGGWMDGTRQDILDAVIKWVSDFDAPNIFWINGHPGIGKSAIAASLVELLQEMGRLGSSYFFQREKAITMTPHALWRTVAYDLGRQYPSIRERLVEALNTNTTLLKTANTDNLFHRLIQDPLNISEGIPAEKLPVIVIDALDECGGLDRYSDHRVNTLASLKSWSSLSKMFKLIVTSRGEADIEQFFSTINHSPLEIKAGCTIDSNSSNDVKKFLQARFRQIVARYHGTLSLDWPGPQIIDYLNDKAGGLFIWAKTIMDFLTRGEPREQLARILEGNGTGGLAPLYSWILNTTFPDPSQNIIKSFHDTVGTIILAKEPLPASSLGYLCSVDPTTMYYIFNGLQSVLETSDIPRFRHHLSTLSLIR